MLTSSLRRPMVHVAGPLALVLGAALVVAGERGDAPGAMLLGLCLVLGTLAAWFRSARSLIVGLVGAGAMAAGLADDAPGAVLIGLLLVAGALAWTVAGSRRPAG